MGKHKRSKHYNSDSESCSNYSKKRRSSKEYTKTDQKDGKNRNRKTPEKEVTNLVNFSFLDHKLNLNKVLIGFQERDKLIDDPNDFWIFVNKYENLLKRSGQSILPEPIDDEMRDVFPKIYSKTLSTGIRLSIPSQELSRRISSLDRTSLTDLKLKQFMNIVVHYLDFKQKEKFNKLKKLRKWQENLPVYQYKSEILSAVQDEQVILIAGDTGCGKSTQVPQYLYQAGYESIACTQPRRIACISLSKRVSHEMLCEFGTDVGYQIRFERSKSKHTKIVFITEGLLLRQLSNEAILSQYDVIILDEIHERNLHGDFLLGVAKCLLKVRPELKLILMSATINVNLFKNYFTEENAVVLEVPGRLFPIQLHYMPQFQDKGIQSKSEHLSPEPYIQIMSLIDNKYPSTEKGDLLIFMSGLNEITTIIEAAKEYAEKKSNWIILPLHSTLSIADQDKVFDYAPEGIRKCIVSTNIAETSVTIDGIRFVIDSGKVKEMSYDPATKMQRLKEFWISKASAEQRKGRAGRTGPGVCYRLYSDKTFTDFESYSTPEIHRVPLDSLLLQMIALGLPNSKCFPFIEPPPPESIESSVVSLKQHDALTIDEKLTPLGQALSRLPMDIAIGKMLLTGCVFQQLQPVLTLAAALSVQTPFTNRAYRDHECEQARKSLESDHGDPITILNAYKEWLELKQAKINRRDHAENTKIWCRRRGLEEQRFYEITKLRNQFQDLLNDCGLSEVVDTSSMSSSERAIRHGELRQLKELRKAYKMNNQQKRKILKAESFSATDGDDIDDNDTDIRDVEFRLGHDSNKLNNLVSGATACSYKDLITLKLILVSGLYPQIAIPDEFNYCKSPSQQFYHTEAKPFASLHPLSFFANNTDILKLCENDIIEKPPRFKCKSPLSSKHQLLCYLSLLETTKPYLMSTLRMPAAQTLLLFAHEIDTNMTCSRLICDSWLCLDFPTPESGLNLLFKASNLRRTWNKLLAIKLSVFTDNVQQQKNYNFMEEELWKDLAQFMNSEVGYTISRLLPADLKTIYKDESDFMVNDALDPNPFAENFECTLNERKGGLYITENICFGCVSETDWSIEMEQEISSTEWECNVCKNTFEFSSMEKLQHRKDCTAAESVNESNVEQQTSNRSKADQKSNKKFECPVCSKTLYLTSIDILKHKKSCKRQ